MRKLMLSLAMVALIIGAAIGGYMIGSSGIPPEEWLTTDGQIIREAENRLKEHLTDPESARFKDVKLVVTNDPYAEFKTVCGLVNAKNSFGGYAGLRRFLVRGHAYIGIDAP